ncbi:MAG: tRNA pseudouridine(38-40) synthase TruA [Actinomycetes bacterium]
MDEPATPDAGGGGLVRVRLDLGYDGTDFTGWAKQPGRRTVQGLLEQALETVLRLPAVRVTCAGRTDAGVHARGQVAHTDIPEAAYGGEGPHLIARLNGVLPPDVRLREVRPAAPGFDARFGALLRRYAYRVADTTWGVDPLRRHDVLWHRRPLDLDAMNLAAERLVGEKDFAAFCRHRAGATTVRALLALRWARDENGLAVATVQADAFCHSMVRALVGSLLAVGDGRRPVGWPAEVLARAVRVPDVHVVPARGLTLEEVRYPPDGELPVRAAQTRRKRELAG